MSNEIQKNRHFERDILLLREELAEIETAALKTMYDEGFSGYWVKAIAGFTDEGEPLIPIDLPVTFRSGTNLDRIQESVKSVARFLTDAAQNKRTVEQFIGSSQEVPPIEE